MALVCLRTMLKLSVVFITHGNEVVLIKYSAYTHVRKVLMGMCFPAESGDS